MFTKNGSSSFSSESIPKKVPNSGIIIVKNANTMDQKCLFFQNIIFKTFIYNHEKH